MDNNFRQEGTMPTVDRDIRLTPEQIMYLERLTRDRVHELGRKIARADENRRAGATIQHGTLDRHHEELAALADVRERLEVARKQIQHRLRSALGLARCRRERPFEGSRLDERGADVVRPLLRLAQPAPVRAPRRGLAGTGDVRPLPALAAVPARGAVVTAAALERLATLALPVAERVERQESARVARMAERPPETHTAGTMARALAELADTQELLELARLYARREP